MGAYDFMWNSIQAGQISDLNERIEALEKKVEILKEWIDYLEAERKKNGSDNKQSNSTE